MKIESANLGMESARRAHTVSASSRRYGQTGKPADDGSFLGFLYPGSPGTEDDPSETAGKKGGNKEVCEESGAAETFSDYLGFMRKRVEGIRTGKIGFNAYSEDGAERMRKFREECVNWLLRLFFPDFHRRFRESSFGMPESFRPFMGIGGKSIGIGYAEEYYYEESEETSFQTTGSVLTSDGRKIDFDLNLKMSRSFREYCSVEYEKIGADLCDPLVISLDGAVPDLSEQTFFFDIDSDGVEDEISRLIEGSGFLALDKNDDGVINDGSELFGTKSGNGFEDLREYDEDGNGFIDENDPVFDRLKIWASDENGNMVLYSLREKGIGAMALQYADTRFSLNSLSDNHTNGVVRNSGIFLYENGGAGLLQQIDLAKHGQRIVEETLRRESA
ncbi:MAG: hypothetical protein K6F53_07715 [Lachnospiraceae bacterium]|nr:hypothetical protein [Lachnospiraceae bacterium]